MSTQEAKRQERVLSDLADHLDNAGLDRPCLPETVHHPRHYGGADNVYEAIKVVEAWGLDFHLGNVVKYLSRAGKKGDELEDLEKAAWYLRRKIELLKEGR